MGTAKFLILKGCAGLGNRLFTTCAAIAYAERNQRKLYVDWSDGQFGYKGENVFYKYFDLAGVDYVRSMPDNNNLHALSIYPKPWESNLGQGIYASFEFCDNDTFPALLKKIFHKANVHGALSKSYGYWKPKHLYLNSKNFFRSLLPVLNSDCFPVGSYYKDGLTEDIVVYADFAPATSAEQFKKHIKLKPQLRADVETFAEKNKLKKNTIGIHIRATDKKPTTGLETIFNKIKGLGLLNPTIFLATDNADVIKLIADRFPNIITFASELPEVPEGMGIHQLGFRSGNGDVATKVFKQSIMDMWLLSECEYLFFQGNSTFSIISSFLHSDQTKVLDWQLNE